MRTILNFMTKEFLQFLRDPKMFAVVLVAPVIQLVFLGYAANRDLNDVKTCILDMDKSESSREFISGFEKSEYFSIIEYADNYTDIERRIDKGDALIAVVVPADFGKDLENGNSASVQVIFDGSDGNKASVAAGYVMSVASSYGGKVFVDRLERSGFKAPPAGSIVPVTRVWYNPNLTTREFMLPSIVGLVLIIITVNITSLAIVKEREIGTLEQLLVTPVRPYQLIIGKLLPFTVVGLVAVTLVLAVMIFWFGIYVKGSIPLLFFSSLVFMLSTLGLGLFVSTISKTQQQAMVTSAFLVIMPMIFLSGFAFPIESMPKIIQYLTYMIPLKYFIVIIRGIVLKGLTMADLWQELGILFLIGVIILVFSSLRFKKSME
ncbi:MAG: ABC transporter permease [Ignavibacteria bacterium]|jgi:ABC-2 type transport system permease protein|nr:ABC transporter permease [Ignavibacteria bacterium]